MAGGRPTLFVKEVKDKIIKAVSKGNYLCDAAEAAGVDPSTLKRWMKQGRLEKSGEYFDFCTAIVKAEKQVISKCVEGVIAQGKKDARHLQWYLERKLPEKWGKDRLQIKQLESRMAELEAREAASRALNRTHGSDGQVAKEAKPK